MGCGKSTVVEALANKLARSFIDLDKQIEALTDRTIADLIEQNRLIAGVATPSQIKDDELRDQFLLMPERVPMRCTYDDAEVLAKYEGLRPDRDRAQNPFNDFVAQAMA